jgi:hypothetical protein
MNEMPVYRIIFKSMPDLILLKDEYHKYGNLLNLCKEWSISLREIVRCKPELINVKDFPTQAWEG